MRAIKRKNTGPERALARALRKTGLRAIRDDARRPGRPDFSFPRARVAVFVDGDFWHGRRRVLPKTNTEWWDRKFRANKARDRRASRALSRMGWTVLRFWETDLDRKGAVALAASRILRLVRPLTPAENFKTYLES